MPAPPPNRPAPLPPPERFNPTTLDHAVIAIPLLEKINEEKALVEAVREEHPDKIAKYNCVILLPAKTSVTSAAIKAQLESVVKEALENTAPDIQAKHPPKPIGPRLPGRNGVFAWLDARIIRRILNRQDVRLSRGEKLPLTIERILPSRFKVIIDLNLEFIGGREKAREWVRAAVAAAVDDVRVDDPGQRINEDKSEGTNQYVFATLEAVMIARLVEMDAEPITAGDLQKDWSTDKTPKGIKMKVLLPLLANHPPADRPAALEAMPKAKLRAIYRIWPDFEVRTRIMHSISTVKANAAINSFAARGAEITWAVLDTGIQGDHPHFQLRNNILDPASPLHRNFTSDEAGPLVDANGHGTHVAGIIAGEWKATRDNDGKPVNPMTAVSRFKDEHGDAQQKVQEIEAISGMAPECRLVSLKVLDENGIGNASNLIAAIAHVQEKNGYGRHLLIQGMNISIGYDFDPKWFACGKSPLCVEVDRLVKSGVVVVVAAGNTGYGAVNNGSSSAGLTVTINDPGNADLAITVGSTHRDMPHVYGVSYFSSKGPTGDGRLKPDLVAPGEKIVSCASALPLPAGAAAGAQRAPSELKREVAKGQACDYIETSGTSMAAPHVSGLVAAFLSVRREFIGQPERVKEIFISTCTDLRRDRYFQGAGLIDLMRAIQSV